MMLVTLRLHLPHVRAEPKTGSLSWMTAGNKAGGASVFCASLAQSQKRKRDQSTKLLIPFEFLVGTE